VTGDDYNTSGVAERLLGTRRVIIFDRPDTATANGLGVASLDCDCASRIAAQGPERVGGTLVALAFAIRHQSDTAGLVLLSGYYFRPFAWMH
jgi:hypothetical protein